MIEAALEDLELKQTIFARAGRRRAARRHARHQHERAFGRRDRRTDPSSRAGPRVALLQPGPGDAARRGRGATSGCARDRRSRHRTHGSLGQDPGSMRRYARVHREPREPAIHHRGAADPGGRTGDGRGDRRSDARRRVPDGAVRADGPGRTRRQPRSRPRRVGAARATGAPAPVTDPGGDGCGGSTRSQDRDRVLRYVGWPATGQARSCRPWSRLGRWSRSIADEPSVTPDPGRRGCRGARGGRPHGVAVAD